MCSHLGLRVGEMVWRARGMGRIAVQREDGARDVIAGSHFSQFSSSISRQNRTEPVCLPRSCTFLRRPVGLGLKLTTRANPSGATFLDPVPRAPAVDVCPGGWPRRIDAAPRTPLALQVVAYRLGPKISAPTSLSHIAPHGRDADPQKSRYRALPTLRSLSERIAPH
jgi:hypothetical protein